MKLSILRACFRVTNLPQSIAFYEKFLNLKLVRTMRRLNYEIAVLAAVSNPSMKVQLIAFDNGIPNPRTHTFEQVGTLLMVSPESIEELKILHQQSNLIIHEIQEFGIYFIKDLDENWIEILPPIIKGTSISITDPAF